MRLFETPGMDAAYDTWLTTTPQDREHLDDCNCERCHAYHVLNWEVVENAELPDFECCRVERENLATKGEICPNGKRESK